ncbi:diacylglycerol kinase [Rhodococcus fascians]|uniref:diacylglycerol kinase n=1 Tax=Rhodococcoides fascians TaxID=1828 RepID=UPI001C92A19F|nr:diacylglycerol kinase [Rhodococcus fascians]MBY4138740.1 diacylglycerol kinase [Rhodococcus fascians]MBY4217018.1 diacylglycerol kinase [Rhodococcus fascians]MBY4223282.1 diacylglycerol kinase [Rhodococcus fascians]MBY4231541.1 diacylglycerol kinase [Rhodococcus fascians]
MTRSVTVLTNPTAGGGRAVHAARRAVTRLRERELDVSTVEGRTAGDALELLKRAVGRGTDAVVAVGGDGVVNLALQVIAGTDTPLGLIPAGTGNDLARTLGVPLDDPTRAADLVVDGVVTSIDLGRVGTRWFGTVLSSGFDSLVTERAGRLQWLAGPLRYNAAMILQLAALRTLSYTIELDDAELHLDAVLVAVGNGSSYGGGMAICPTARVDDGLFAITVVRDVSRTRLLALSPTLYRGAHVDLPEVEVYSARNVTVHCDDMVAYADGERIAELPVTIECVPRALRVFVGADSPLRT